MVNHYVQAKGIVISLESVDIVEYLLAGVNRNVEFKESPRRCGRISLNTMAEAKSSNCKTGRTRQISSPELCRAVRGLSIGLHSWRHFGFTG